MFVKSHHQHDEICCLYKFSFALHVISMNDDGWRRKFCCFVLKRGCQNKKTMFFYFFVALFFRLKQNNKIKKNNMTVLGIRQQCIRMVIRKCFYVFVRMFFYFFIFLFHRELWAQPNVKTKLQLPYCKWVRLSVPVCWKEKNVGLMIVKHITI